MHTVLRAMTGASGHRQVVDRWRSALYDFEPQEARRVLSEISHSGAEFRLSFPFETMSGPDAFWKHAIEPLVRAWPDIERRDQIVVAGFDGESDWVGCAGHYIGTFAHPWLDIPPTGHVAHLRFHEFYCIKEGKVAQMQAVWDIPEVMLQAWAWPMSPSLGREWCVPAPATQDGLDPKGDGIKAQARVIDMLEHMSRHPAEGGPDVMEMQRFWHPKMMWYGPAGIGTARGVAGFRNWHQIPFLAAMPDRGQHSQDVRHHFFSQGNYVAVTGWPNMSQTLTDGGFLGIAPAGKKVHLRSLDFWRLEAGLIRENWVMVDLLSLYDQLGVDVFARLREFNKARLGFDPETGRAA